MDDSTYFQAPPLPPKKVTLDDCCLRVTLRAFPRYVFDQGELDFIAQEEVGWPFPRVYWDNGTMTEGGIDTKVALELLAEGNQKLTADIRQRERQAQVMQARWDAGMS